MSEDTRDGAAPEKRQAVAFIINPPCAVCGKPSAHMELVPPGDLPSRFPTWKPELQETFHKYHDPSKWRWLFEGSVTYNGLGSDITEEQAATETWAFSEPFEAWRLREVECERGAGFCARCELFYCEGHWNSSVTGYGKCPEGHGETIDPHWSPDDSFFDL